MKKDYLTPQVETVKLEMRQLLSGSLGAVGDVESAELDFVDGGIASGSGDR